MVDVHLYELAIHNIIRQQEDIIGSFARDQASKVGSIRLNETGEVHIDGDPKETLSKLVNVYADFFGQASVEVCKDAIRSMKGALSQADLPDILK